MQDELQKLAEELNIEYVTLIQDDWLDTSLISKIPFDWAKKNSVLPIKRDGKYYILTSSPEETQLLDHISMIINHSFDPIATDEAIISIALEKVYFDKDDTAEDFLDDMENIDVEYKSSNKITTDLLTATTGAPVSQLVNLILLGAVKQKASDIHFEPFENRTRIRYRVDGIMYEQTSPPKSMESSLISRLKVMAHLDIAEKRQPQDGMAKIRVGKREIDMRVSTVPVAEGERIVLRLLDKSTAMTSLETLGMNKHVKKDFDKLLKQTNGIIIVSGPTGSGKTTSLYAALNQLDSTKKNIMTIEDPIEYQLENIGQIQVNTKIGLLFSKGLRHILRQDPDIVLVGETRDLETAEISIRASLTGHLVLTTLHTNDAPGSIIRMIDMGIEPYLLSSCLRGAMGQRLVRCLCENCKEETKVEPHEIELLGKAGEKLIGKTVWKASEKGCKQCLEGYSGRMGIYELLTFSNDMKNALRQRNINSDELTKMARENGMISMIEDGIDKILDGKTTIEEVTNAAASII
ncbi:MAG: ATPase, T2SS/T4P/T4SS family [Kiritimatiellae bacterium]|jgi:general secretion pathway protein E|nr:ATPase, T2SS/T4P/T4SS family [Kiritimatiellia bacterium]